MTKKGSTKIVNSMTPRAGVLVKELGHMSKLSSSLSICTLGCSFKIELKLYQVLEMTESLLWFDSLWDDLVDS